MVAITIITDDHRDGDNDVDDDRNLYGRKKKVITTIKKRVSVMNMVMSLMLTISDDDDNDLHKRYKKGSQ